ncbi:hypothetical protein PHYBOEH_012065 [Phytophthora boehmeriae]|uniref:Alpha/beta hydrolase fold-3 domain-containing protein n=1 Tax=Phytophthora boehmeriae TaxID=109152 RepID=A0A8T1WYC5_9STRA|nr:hypothetical protein PHYBOEH_012065 [Phytophthora boehmeriae]
MCCAPWESVLLLLRITSAVFTTFTRYVTRNCTPKFPNWSLRFELLHAVIRECTEAYGERMVVVKHARVIRSQSDALGSVLGWFSCRQLGRRLEPVHFNGLEHVWLRPMQSRGRGARRLVVLYLHGGGFAVLSPRLYISLGAALAFSIEKKQKQHHTINDRIEILLGNYRKAPEYQFPAQPMDAMALYENYLLESEGLEPSQIILAGDSAGGGLVMSVLLRLRDTKPELFPLAGMLISPAVDLSGDEPEAPHCFLSPNLCAAVCTAYHANRNDPSEWADASSVHRDLRDLPPVFLQAGRLDYIYQQSDRLAAKAAVDGATNWEVDIHDDMPHVFSIFPVFVLPYAQVGVQKLAAFAAKQFLKSGYSDSILARSR